MSAERTNQVMLRKHFIY